MKKLKDILLEGYAWERTPGKPLPTLSEVQAEYERKNEASNPLKTKIAKLEKDLANLKHQYYSDPNMTDEKSQKLRKQMGPIIRDLKRAKREDKTGSAGYKDRKNAKPDFLDLDKDGNTEEPMKDAADDMENMKEGDDENHGVSVPKLGVKPYDDAYEDTTDAMNENFWGRVKGNLHGHEHILRESFRK
jgi:hypothetical protein